MITEFFIYSRHAVEAVPPHDVPHIIVSITTPGDPDYPAKIKTNHATLGLLRLTFHDLDRIPPGHEEFVVEAELFQPSQARQILAMVKEHPTAQRLIVHCDAGLSRSPAVAAALSKILVGNDDYFFRDYHPNRRVYRMILDEHYGSYKDMER